MFTNLAPAWRTIYARKSQPVLIERKLGLGTIVMATDSYFLSNEALLKDRQPELLAWLVGPGQRILFDEAHLGIVEESGITVLMHKYRLQTFGLALLLLAGLFIWQNATSFPPAAPVPQSTGPVTGKEAAAGFINLLRGFLFGIADLRKNVSKNREAHCGQSSFDNFIHPFIP